VNVRAIIGLLLSKEREGCRACSFRQSLLSVSEYTWV